MIRWKLSVSETLRRAGIEPNKHLDWSIGREMVQANKATMGCRPEFAMCPKTDGTGSHEMAVYEAWQQAKIVSLARAKKAEQARQGFLCFDPSEKAEDQP